MVDSPCTPQGNTFKERHVQACDSFLIKKKKRSLSCLSRFHLTHANMPKIVHSEHFKLHPLSDASTTKQPFLKGNKGTLIHNRFSKTQREEEGESTILIFKSKWSQNDETGTLSVYSVCVITALKHLLSNVQCNTKINKFIADSLYEKTTNRLFRGKLLLFLSLLEELQKVHTISKANSCACPHLLQGRNEIKWNNKKHNGWT